MSGTERLRRRDQQVVARLVQGLEGEESFLERARARARSLPTMLRRHGPIPVLLFLESKRGDSGDGIDPRLGGWLLHGVAEVLPETPSELGAYADDLATMPLERYLLHWRTCVETAGWLKRLIEARVAAARGGGDGD